MSLRVYEIGTDKVIKYLEKYSSFISFDEVSCKLPQGVYSTFRTYENGKKVVGLKAHMERLFSPSRDLCIEAVISQNEIRIILRTLLAEDSTNEVRIRISLSLTENAGHVFIMLEDLKPLSEEIYQKGVFVVTSNTVRETPRIKSTAFIQQSIFERKALLTQNIYEVLIVQDGKVLEGMTSNFYVVKTGKIITARYGILLGVTRRVILNLMRKSGYEIYFRPFRIVELPTIEEAFISSSSRGVVPVVNIDGTSVGQGAPGTVARILRKLYDDYIIAKADYI